LLPTIALLASPSSLLPSFIGMGITISPPPGGSSISHHHPPPTTTIRLHIKDLDSSSWSRLRKSSSTYQKATTPMMMLKLRRSSLVPLQARRGEHHRDFQTHNGQQSSIEETTSKPGMNGCSSRQAGRRTAMVESFACFSKDPKRKVSHSC
jgi:hypothetical protein